MSMRVKGEILSGSLTLSKRLRLKEEREAAGAEATGKELKKSGKNRKEKLGRT
jgi:hypothetical protein